MVIIGKIISRNGRLIAGLVGFVVLTAASVSGWMIRTQKTQSDTSGVTSKSEQSRADSGGSADVANRVFYESLGDLTRSLPTPERDQSLPAGQYTLLITSTHDRSAADQLVAELKAQAIDAYLSPVIRNGEVIYHVRRGLFRTESLATAAADELRQRHELPSKIVLLQ